LNTNVSLRVGKRIANSANISSVKRRDWAPTVLATERGRSRDMRGAVVVLASDREAN
jgi:hypothetical protein